jgi:serine O-acetyltransferase
MLKQDILRTYNMAEGSRLHKLIRCYRAPGVHAVTVYRFGQWLKRQSVIWRLFLEPFFVFSYHRIRSKWGIEIPRGADIGPGLYIGHYGAITIAGTTKIGKNANISQQKTIGISGEGDKKGSPTIGDNVYIAPGAKVFGKIIIGHNVKIGANAVVYKDIPDNAIVVMDPGFKIISLKGNR